MKKDSKITPHVLLCYDGTPASYKALSYLKQVFEKTSIEVTLLKIIEHPETYAKREISLIKKFTQEEDMEKKAKELYIKAEKELKEVGESLKTKIKGNIYTKVVFRYGEIVQDILRLANENLYDAIVVGRRGLSKISTFILGGVTHKLIHSSSFPVWLIRGKSWNKKFLVALDLGEPGLKLADYISFILAFHKEAEVAFCHTFYPFSDLTGFTGTIEELIEEVKHPQAKNFFIRLKNTLIENQMPLNKPRFIIKRGIFGPAGEIIRLAKKEGFGTVVIGRRGKGTFKSFFLGSVSQKIISYFEDRAIWVIN